MLTLLAQTDSYQSLAERILGTDVAHQSATQLPNDVVVLHRAYSTALHPKGITKIEMEDAGTAMRFATAFFGLRASIGAVLLTGTERLNQRPIAALLTALKALGAKVLEKGGEDHPPLVINPIPHQKAHEVWIDGSVSSQFISALLLLAPSLPLGLILYIEGTLASGPYVELTLNTMTKFGIKHILKGNSIRIARGQTIVPPALYKLEADWSAAGYFYSLVGLCAQPGRWLALHGLLPNSAQGDKILAKIFAQLGVQTKWMKGHYHIRYHSQEARKIAIDFAPIPDQAQTLIVYCAAKGIAITATGLGTLRGKETDRIAALQAELLKLGITLAETAEGVFEIAGTLNIQAKAVAIATYADHRMAMAFAPLRALCNVDFDDETVVRKSFPAFWQTFAAALRFLKS